MVIIIKIYFGTHSHLHRKYRAEQAVWQFVSSFIIDAAVRSVFLFQAEDGIRDLVRSRGLGDVYKRQDFDVLICYQTIEHLSDEGNYSVAKKHCQVAFLARVDQHIKKLCYFNAPNRTYPVDGHDTCLLYTSDAADERSSVDLGGRRIIKKK